MSLRSILSIAVMTLCAMTAMAQENEKKAMQLITSNPKEYIWGTGIDASETAAKEAAKVELINNIRASVSTEAHSTIDNDGESFESYYSSYSATTLRNCSSICYFDKKKKMFSAMYYVSREDLAKEVEERQDLICSFIDTGLEQEGKLNIADALKYYNWALMMLTAYNDKFMVELEGRERLPKPWLEAHISMILDNINIELATNKVDIDYAPDEIDKYTVNLNVTYANEPVSALDISYFNGLRDIKPIHVKNGDAALAFMDLSDMKEINVNVVYDYPQEAKNHDELQAIYDANNRQSYGNKHRRSLPIKVKKDNISQPKKKETKALASTENAFDTKPIIETPMNTISRPVVDDAQLTETLVKVEKALRSRKYQAVRSLFTDEGWDLFSRMTNLSKIKVSKTPEKYVIESTPLTTIGKGIPVTVSNDRHVANETIVFRFEKGTGLIKSVAFALTKRAEDDIFRECTWSIESRYALLQFMEDYQTAFALKRDNFIEDIFSDNAVIITGHFTNGQTCKRFYEGDELKSSGKSVKYTRHTKDSYLKALRQDFKDNKFIQLIFEDAVISKVDTRGFSDSEIMWIELKQHYNSSTYSDKGFLALMIHLKPEGSQIHVRTWTPEFVEITDLKQRFKIGN